MLLLTINRDDLKGDVYKVFYLMTTEEKHNHVTFFHEQNTAQTFVVSLHIYSWGQDMSFILLPDNNKNSIYL